MRYIFRRMEVVNETKMNIPDSAIDLTFTTMGTPETQKIRTFATWYEPVRWPQDYTPPKSENKK